MGKLNLLNIKKENIKNVFNTILNQEAKISRADIAVKTDLSIMTIGKIVDALITNKILIQSKEIKGSAGRKAGLVMINPERLCFVIDLTSYDFSLTIVHFNLQPDEKIVYLHNYNKDYSYQENLIIFFRDIKMYFDKKFKSDTKYYGTGVILPGKYNVKSDNVIYECIPELEHIKIKSFIEDIFNQEIIYIESDMTAAARSITHTKRYRDKKEKIIIFVNINRQNFIRNAVIFDGEVINNNSPYSGNIGNNYVGEKLTLQNVIDKCHKIEDCLIEICHIIHNYINLLTPDVIAIECDMVKTNSDIEMHIRNCLINEYKLNEKLMPEIFICSGDIKHSQRGHAMQLRDIWFEKML